MRQGLRLLIGTACVAALCAGCSDLGKPLLPRPEPVLSASSLDFGTVTLSDSATRAVTIGNTGTAPLVGAVTLNCEAHYVVSGGGPFSIPPGSSATVVLGFRPGDAVSYSCALDLGSSLPRVSLSGTGALQAPGALCVLVPDSLDFGTVPVGESATRSFQVFSVGTAPLLVDIVSGCGDYEVVSGGGPASLAPGGSVTVMVRLAPQAGLRRACAIAVGPGCPEAHVSGFATTISFANDVQPIFRAWCQGCHTFGDIGDPQSGYAILTVGRSAYPPGVMVVPYDLVSSVLYGKITNSGQYGALMPQGGPLLPLANRETIRSWILEGARDN
jgi:hypothetical protein